jgi:hypothetical protein
MFPFQKKNKSLLPEDVKRELITITEFLASMPPAARSQFVNEFIVKKVGEAIGDHYKKMIEMQSNEVQATLRKQLAVKEAEQVREAISQVMRIILNALEEIDTIYKSAKFEPGSPTEQVWKITLVAAQMRVVNTSLQAYDGLGDAFDDAVDLIRALITDYKQKFLPLNEGKQNPNNLDEG